MAAQENGTAPSAEFGNPPPEKTQPEVLPEIKIHQLNLGLRAPLDGSRPGPEIRYFAKRRILVGRP